MRSPASWTLAAGVLAVVALFLFTRWRAASRSARDAQTRLAASERHVASLQATARDLESAVARLSKYTAVADADEDAARLTQAAQETAQALRAEADAIRATAAREAEDTRGRARAEWASTVAEAKRRAESLEADAASQLSLAQRQAAEIIAQAEARAEATAGTALEALREREENERVVRAIENTINGYGDRYIVPGHTLLDDLAEGFGHTEAGQNLKGVRDRVRAAVRSGAAATCDYVEPNRRESAIRFIVDAFNGKAESILALVKHDNVGTLQQQMRDAYALVNRNGAAFRDARITRGYLDLRLEELRWAAVVQELKLQEREEQRRIKEQIREEEKARREYERALKEAAREEELVRTAMQKAEQQLAKASDAQRARYEAQLAELSARLTEAEARGQRALSMAQQTKRGHVYIISNVGSFGEHVYKIGLTRRLDPADRIRELGDSSVPFEFDVHALIFAEDAPTLEHRLHRHFVFNQVNKVNYRKEFFRAELAHIRAEVESLGLTAQWTMTAAAREYHETLAIEQAIRDNPAAREAWLNRQLLLEPIDGPVGEDEAEDESVSAPPSRPAGAPLPAVTP